MIVAGRFYMKYRLRDPQQGHIMFERAWLVAKPMLFAGHELVLELKQPAKSREQEEKYHAMVGDIAKQLEFCGRKWDGESMKRILVDQFRRDTAKDPDLQELWIEMGTVETCPSLDGTGVVVLGWQTRRFSKRLAIAFIEWLYALGAERDIVWSEPVEVPA